MKTVHLTVSALYCFDCFDFFMSFLILNSKVLILVWYWSWKLWSVVIMITAGLERSSKVMENTVCLWYKYWLEL